MNFELTPTQDAILKRVKTFMDEHVRPAIPAFDEEMRAFGNNRWQVVQTLEQLKKKAKDEGLWNMFMPPHNGHEPVDDSFVFEGLQLSNLDYALVAEEMGKVWFAPAVFNCMAPDTGNMEVLLRYGSLEQKEKWLRPLMNGEIRSAFLMTEPDVASSDATNIETLIERDGDEYVINGKKWWSSGVGYPDCKIAIIMGKTDPSAPKRAQQSQILVPLDTPGVKIERMLDVFGYDEAPYGHAEMSLTNVRVPVSNIILGEGRGFEIAQGRLGPGRIHHCMRTIGSAEVALEKMVRRLMSRKTFGKYISQHSIWEQRIAEARINIEMSRLLCLKASDMMDRAGNQAALLEIAMTKVAVPTMALKVIDDAIQAHGGGGVCADYGLASNYGFIRTLRIADGPDEVHNRTVARMEYKKYSDLLDIQRNEADERLLVPGIR